MSKSNRRALRWLTVAYRPVAEERPFLDRAQTQSRDGLEVTIVVTGEDARTTIGFGPLLVTPTATDAALGADDTWQAGAAAVVVRPLEGGSLIGGLLTWQTDFAGGDNRVDTNLVTGQLFLTMSIGGGWYLRSSPLSVFDFENDAYLIPVGLGAGKILRLGGAIVNAFVEPQFTVYRKGQGLPSLQVFVGLNLQFVKK